MIGNVSFEPCGGPEKPHEREADKCHPEPDILQGLFYARPKLDMRGLSKLAHGEYAPNYTF